MQPKHFFLCCGRPAFMLLVVPVVGGHRRVGLDKGIVVLWFRMYIFVCMHFFS